MHAMRDRDSHDAVTTVLAVLVIISIDNAGNQNIIQIDTLFLDKRSQIHVVIGIHAIIIRTHLHDIAGRT